MTRDELVQIAEAERARAADDRHEIRVCMAASCLSSQADQVKAALDEAVKAGGHRCRVKGVGCLGLCKEGPLVAVEPAHRLYQAVTPADAPALVASLDGPPVEHLAGDLGQPFFARQSKIALENSGRIDPERIEEYIAADGYLALVDALTSSSPAAVLQQVTRSGLRGRGGGGYPTGLKWSTVAKARPGRKFVICNGDEGDPGAFMDRSVLESDPHRVIEGMALAAYAVGASEGFLYVRAEYPLAVRRLKQAIRQAEKLGLLGANICDTTFGFRLDLRLGAGAFVCGEETALIASIEGGRGTPRPRPPYPAESGLWGCPTLINNVETFASVAPILRKGGEWFASLGTAKSKGTKVFALAGRVVNSGLVEVPMGITLREIIFEVGGGIPEGKRFKAVQTGGPSGGCIPEQHLDMPVDYDSLSTVGSIMGSGGMIVMDETSCMVDVARYFMDFCATESCGKCVPCRVGTVQLHNLLAKMTHGTATLADLTLLEELCEVVQRTSLCGLGQSAPNPVLTTLRFFRDEYLAHIVEKRCPAGVCRMKVPAGVTA
jgi:bidirectional [NiFe] hydrogenase diaphorase subunit